MSYSAVSRAARLGAIRISGADASKFLRAQLTNDVLRLGTDRHFLAAWCDAKGRAQLIARVCTFDDGYLLILPQALVEGMIKRLRMFVLRAQVQVADASDAVRITGRTGDGLPAAGTRAQRGDVCLLGLPAGHDGVARALSIAPPDAASAESGMATDDNAWERLEIDSGLPTVVTQTQGLFVPQMLNLHWLGAVDFGKGCYPGQEVIARLQYRGRLTRRLFRLQWQGQMPGIGDDVLDAAGNRQGTVIRAAFDAPDRGTALAVLKVAAVGEPLRTGDTELTLGDLPYATPA